MYLGIDLGTSAIKFIIIDDSQSIIFIHDEPLKISRPHPLWSEQQPNDWWQAVLRGFQKLKSTKLSNKICAISLSGQMHGAVLLDKYSEVLRPAILWNDGRSAEQCLEINPLSIAITGNLAMPGFTAGKLLWIKQYEPDIFSKISKVLLPKDYLRYKLSGDFATDMSDASGTLWLDIAKRQWSKDMLAACYLDIDNMPKLFEGCEQTGHLNSELAKQWDMQAVPIIAGGGDNAAGAIGCGVIKPNQAMLSLGTSGVYFVATDGFLQNPQKAIHSFCHALPDRWHLMSVILNAASCLDWGAKLVGSLNVADFIDLVKTSQVNTYSPIFLPYLSGERTPLNNPLACGVFFGLTAIHNAADIAYAIMEGVGFALADAIDALHETGVRPQSATIIGGGAKSDYWRQLLADIIGINLDYREGGSVGPAFGAARLAQIACHGGKIAEFCSQPPLLATHYFDKTRHQQYLPRREKFRTIYDAVKTIQ